MTSGCAHPGRVWVPGRSAGRSDSCASREPPLQDWLDNWQPRGIPCVPISSRVYKPHLMTPPASQACRYWGLTSMCGITRTDADGGPVSSPASWTTRGEDHPTARLLDLVPGRSGTVHENWREERSEDFRSSIQIATLDPFQGYKNAIDDQLQDTTSVLDAFHIVKLAGDAPGEVRRRVQQDTLGHRARTGDPFSPGPQSFARLA